MPAQQAPMPIATLASVARQIFFDKRNAVAAGPMMRAVERTDPSVIALKPTLTEVQTRKITPRRRLGTPCARAISGESDANVKGRAISPITPTMSMASSAATGMVAVLTLKIEPNKTCCVTPVVVELVAVR